MTDKQPPAAGSSDGRTQPLDQTASGVPSTPGSSSFMVGAFHSAAVFQPQQAVTLSSQQQQQQPQLPQHHEHQQPQQSARRFSAAATVPYVSDGGSVGIGGVGGGSGGGRFGAGAATSDRTAYVSPDGYQHYPPPSQQHAPHHTQQYQQQQQQSSRQFAPPTDALRRLSLSSLGGPSVTHGGPMSAPAVSYAPPFSQRSAGAPTYGRKQQQPPQQQQYHQHHHQQQQQQQRPPYPTPISTLPRPHSHGRRGPQSAGLEGIQSIWESPAPALPDPAPATRHSGSRRDTHASFTQGSFIDPQLSSQLAPPASSAALSTALPGPILAAGQFPNRPHAGTVGRPIRVRANFFQFITLPGRDLYHYDVKITPEVPPSLNRRIFREVVQMYGRDKLGGTVAVYDGRRNLYAPSELPLPTDQTAEWEITLSDTNDAMAGAPAPHLSATPLLHAVTPASPSAPSPGHGPRRFTFRLRFVERLNMANFGRFLQGDGTDTPFGTLQAIDVIMRHRPSMMLTSVGRSFFTRNDFKMLGDGAECWMGYHQSVRPTQGRLMMNIDVSATAFYEPGPALAFLARNLGKRAASDLKSPLKAREAEKCDRLLRGVKVQVTHRGEMRRRYKIHGLSRTATDMTFFKYTANSTVAADGSQQQGATEVEISVAEYFARHYNVQLQFPYLPCAKVGTPQRTVYLPLEVCDIVPGQRFLRKLNEQQTAQMIRLTCQTPDRRANKISQAIGELGLDRVASGMPVTENIEDSNMVTNDARYLDAFGVRLSDEMATVPARILDPPTIQYHPTSREPVITPRDGCWNLRDKKVVQPATLHSWAIICFGSPRDMPQQKIDDFLREMISTCRDTGLTITNAHPPAIYCEPSSSRTAHVEESMQTAWQAAGEAVQSFPQLIMCILPNTGVPLYAEIKRVGDTVLGVPTQCLQVKHTFLPKKQYCANVCLKINAKLGGVNSFIVRNPAIPGDNGMPWVAEVPTIIFGADITHPAHGESRENGSVCALVGSLDRLASRYAATVRLQPPRREVIMALSSMVQEMLKIFYLENNQIAPQRILFYRDGVSESHFHEVVVAELAAIREACTQLQDGYCPTITYVVVQKRHHARVFAMHPKDADRSGNIPAGTVIDSHITHPNQYDFYLCSHAGLQGTSRPTHYHVLHDENGFGPDMLQELTYRLCFGYARCTRSVSVVPPAYYADLVAFRAKYHMKNGGYSMSNYSGPYGSTSVPSGSVTGRDTAGTEQLRSTADWRSQSAGDDDDASDSNYAAASSTQRKGRRRRGDDAASREEDEELMKRLQARLAAVKPELQKVMYFM